MFNRPKNWGLAFFLTALLLAGQRNGLAAELNIFAAASLSDSLTELAQSYQRKTGDKIYCNYAASSFLARQIEEGAPADLFFSADIAKVTQLARSGHVLTATWTNLLSNRLVIIVPKSNGLQLSSPQQLTEKSIRRVALAQPETVPAGIYARQYLVQKKLWEKMEPKVVPTDNVRAALAAVAAGNADAAIVYKTDVSIVRDVVVAYEVPNEDNPDIRYPLVMLKNSRNAAAARKFWEFLTSAEAAQVFKRHGFIVSR